MHRGRARAGLLLMWTLATVQITPALVDTAAQPRCDASKLVSLSDRSAAIASATSPQSRRDTLIAWPQFKIAQAMSFRHDFPQEDWTIEQLSESETHTCVRVSGRTRCVINVGLFATPEGTVYSRYQTGWLESISDSGALTDMCSGDLFTCGILASPDRRLRCWGDPVACEQGVCSPPTVLSGFAELTCGTYHACAIEVGTGSMHCWGSNDDRQAQAPQGPFRAVSAAARHTCGLRKSGHVECWGSNEGVGESEGVSTWQAKPPPVLLQAVAAGDMHSCGILAPPRPTQSARPPAGGRIVCWGDNRRLQASPPSFRAVAIFCGAQHSCAVTADGNLLVCWGDKTIGNRFRANEQDGPASPPQHLTICPPDNQGRSIRHYELHYSGDGIESAGAGIALEGVCAATGLCMCPWLREPLSILGHRQLVNVRDNGPGQYYPWSSWELRWRGVACAWICALRALQCCVWLYQSGYASGRPSTIYHCHLPALSTVGIGGQMKSLVLMRWQRLTRLS